MTIDGVSLFRNCSKPIHLIKNEDTVSCVLNIRLAYDNITILGEPFLRFHYSVFDIE